MVKHFKSSEIYASQLVHLGYGHPLWYPEPSTSGEVEIGDVGYIDDGGFHRLFNACRDKNDPVNKNGIPDGFEPLRLPAEMIRDRTPVVKPGDSLCSDSVRNVKVDLNAQASAGPASAGGGYSFSTKGKRGAVAILKDGGTQKSISRSAAFQRYILDNHMSWHAFARQRGVSLKVQNIVLVSGFVKTTEWALSAYYNGETSQEVSLSVNANAFLSADAAVSVEQQHNIGLVHREGPSPGKDYSSASPPDSPLADTVIQRPQDQCVFLQYYKCQPRLLGVTVLKQPQNLKPKDMLDSVGDECFCAPFNGFVSWVKRHFGGWGGRVEVENEQPPEEAESEKPHDESTEDPVAVLLEHILKSSSGKVAVTSHADLYDLFRGIKWPANIREYLKEHGPNITVDDNGVAQLDVAALPSPPPVPDDTLHPVPDSTTYTPSTPADPSPPPPAPPAQDAPQAAPGDGPLRSDPVSPRFPITNDRPAAPFSQPSDHSSADEPAETRHQDPRTPSLPGSNSGLPFSNRDQEIPQSHIFSPGPSAAEDFMAWTQKAHQDMANRARQDMEAFAAQARSHGFDVPAHPFSSPIPDDPLLPMSRLPELPRSPFPSGFHPNIVNLSPQDSTWRGGFGGSPNIMRGAPAGNYGPQRQTARRADPFAWSS